jgi:ComF family protein
MKSQLHNFKIIQSIFQKIILDSLFPIQCLGCGNFDDWICEDCHSTLPILTQQQCPICKKVETKNGETCPNCLKKEDNFIDGVFVASSFQDKLLKKAIHYYKYRFVYDLSKPLSLLLAQSLFNSTVPAPDIIIPVPLHKRRARWRGFNQSELLAKNLDLQIPLITDTLLRTKYTIPQVKMKNRNKRQQNLNNAFTVKNTQHINGKNVLLIDDVLTTGTTLNKCAKVLKQSGCNKVFCLVLARE